MEWQLALVEHCTAKPPLVLALPTHILIKTAHHAHFRCVSHLTAIIPHETSRSFSIFPILDAIK